MKSKEEIISILKTFEYVSDIMIMRKFHVKSEYARMILESMKKKSYQVFTNENGEICRIRNY